MSEHLVPFFLCLHLAICAIAHALQLFVLCFQLSLHLEIGLSFALDFLLFHVTYHTGVHELHQVSISTSALDVGLVGAYSLVYFLLAMHEHHNANCPEDCATESQLRGSGHDDDVGLWFGGWCLMEVALFKLPQYITVEVPRLFIALGGRTTY